MFGTAEHTERLIAENPEGKMNAGDMCALDRDEKKEPYFFCPQGHRALPINYRGNTLCKGCIDTSRKLLDDCFGCRHLYVKIPPTKVGACLVS